MPSSQVSPAPDAASPLLSQPTGKPPVPEQSPARPPAPRNASFAPAPAPPSPPAPSVRPATASAFQQALSILRFYLASLWPLHNFDLDNDAEAHVLSPLAQSLVDKYGPYVKPNLARAQRNRLSECDHHTMFSLFRTSPSELSEFGTGHQLYFVFLRFTALAFVVLTVLLGGPLAVAYVWNGSFFSSRYLRKVTLGNYGPAYAEGAALAGSKVRCLLWCHDVVQHRALYMRKSCLWRCTSGSA
jgi:hypothetical protein